MTEMATLELIETAEGSEIDPVMHYYCGMCYPDDNNRPETALCGHVFKSPPGSAIPVTFDATEDDCIVCQDLLEYHYKQEHPDYG